MPTMITATSSKAASTPRPTPPSSRPLTHQLRVCHCCHRNHQSAARSSSTSTATSPRAHRGTRHTPRDSPSRRPRSTSTAHRQRSTTSKPSVGRKIFLDLDGHVTTNPSWNSSYTSGQPITSDPFDLDGSPTTFNDIEATRITEIWQQVVEDYAPFDVDVTTIDPGTSGLTFSGGSDTTYGVRVVISPTNWFLSATGANSGGVAYVGTYRSSVSPPAFVFSATLGNTTKKVAEASSHEAGHTLGLRHDGTSTATYYAGHGDWAPIMGNSYYRSITQWSKGEYPDANNTGQDDMALISSLVGYTPDDHANTAASATPTTPGTNINALISTINDTDVYTLNVPAGTLTATLAPTGQPTNLHARIELRDTAGTIIATATPTQAVGWTDTITTNIPAGTYTIHITNTAWLTPTTGFSNYATTGTYTLTTHHPPTTPTTDTTTTTTAATITTSTTTTTTIQPTTTTIPSTTTASTTTTIQPEITPTVTTTPTTVTTKTTGKLEAPGQVRRGK